MQAILAWAALTVILGLPLWSFGGGVLRGYFGEERWQQKGLRDRWNRVWGAMALLVTVIGSSASYHAEPAAQQRMEQSREATESNECVPNLHDEVRIGMTVAEVKQAVEDEFVNPEDGPIKLWKRSNIAGMEATVGYLFDENKKLMAVTVSFEPSKLNGSGTDEELDIRKILTAKYGEPKEIAVGLMHRMRVWKDDKGRAIALTFDPLALPPRLLLTYSTAENLKRLANQAGNGGAAADL